MLPVKIITHSEYALLVLSGKIKRVGPAGVGYGEYYHNGSVLLERKEETADGAYWYIIMVDGEV